MTNITKYEINNTQFRKDEILGYDITEEIPQPITFSDDYDGYIQCKEYDYLLTWGKFIMGISQGWIIQQDNNLRECQPDASIILEKRGTMKTMKVVYAPSGRAGEYAELATNPYISCDHGCEYCYVPRVLHTTPEEFRQPKLRKDYLKKLEADAVYLKSIGETRPIQLSFMCDPYSKFDEIHQITRRALEILFRRGLNVQILTKGGKRSMRDFDLFNTYKAQVTYGATLVFDDDAEALKREPGAALTTERIAVLRLAHDLGIKTWVSLEPVYNPKDAYFLIGRTHGFVDLYKIGKLNYREEQHNVDWPTFAREVEKRMQALGKQYYLKNDLKEAVKL